MAFYFSENTTSHDGIQGIPLPWEGEVQVLLPIPVSLTLIPFDQFIEHMRNENDQTQWTLADLIAPEPVRQITRSQSEIDMNTPFDSIPPMPGIDDPTILNLMFDHFAPEQPTTGRAPRTRRSPVARQNPLQRGKPKKGKGKESVLSLGSIPEEMFNAFLPSPADCGLDQPFTVQQSQFYINQTGIDLSSIFNGDIGSGDTCLPDEEHDCLPSDEVFGLGRPLTDTEAQFYLQQTSTSIGDYCHEIGQPYPYNHSDVIPDDL